VPNLRVCSYEIAALQNEPARSLDARIIGLYPVSSEKGKIERPEFTRQVAQRNCKQRANQGRSTIIVESNRKGRREMKSKLLVFALATLGSPKQEII
jgi:hypothetical protein